MRDVNALSLGNSMANWWPELCYLRLTTVRKWDGRQGIRHGKCIDRIYCLTLFLAFLIAKSSRNRKENDTEEQIAE